MSSIIISIAIQRKRTEVCALSATLTTNKTSIKSTKLKMPEFQFLIGGVAEAAGRSHRGAVF